MKKIIILVSACLLVSCISFAKDKPKESELKFENYGVGLVVGDPFGVSLKFWQDKDIAYAGVLSWSSGFKFHVNLDMLFHDYEMLANSKKREESLILYYGFGALLRIANDESFIIGGKLPVGIEYMFEASPFDIFIEVSPALLLTPEMKLSFFGGIGARLTF